MRVTQLDLIIPKYMEDSSNLKPRAVLVSGKWGIGKTYALINLINKGNETIDKEGFDFTYIYFSLFGFESVNSIVLQLIKKIDPEYFVQYRDLLSFSSPDEQNDFNGTIIVFDDLERKSKSLTFDALYGLFSSLLQYGFRVVCTCNSDMIPKDEQKYYRIFRDKIFDRVFNVTADDSVFSKVVPDVSVDAKTSFLKDANDNWRIIIKAASFYKEIKTKFNSEKINNYFDVFGVSETDFFRCLVIATSCVFNSFEDMEDTKTQAVDIDEQDKQDFGDNIAFNLWYYFGTKKVNNNLERPTKMLVYSILNNDYNNLVVDIQNKQEQNNIIYKKPFNKPLFYYDDLGKKAFKNSFLDNLEKFDFSNQNHRDVAQEVLRYFINSLSDSEKRLIIDRIVSTVPIDNRDDVFPFLLYMDGIDREALTTFKNTLEIAFENKYSLDKSKSLDKAIETKDYVFLNDFLYKNLYVKNAIKDAFAKKLSEHDFLLPDLAGELTFDEWSYCHEIAEFVRGNEEYSKKFVSILFEKKKNTNSHTFIERYRALINKYGFKEPLPVEDLI